MQRVLFGGLKIALCGVEVLAWLVVMRVCAGTRHAAEGGALQVGVGLWGAQRVRDYGEDRKGNVWNEVDDSRV